MAPARINVHLYPLRDIARLGATAAHICASDQVSFAGRKAEYVKQRSRKRDGTSARRGLTCLDLEHPAMEAARSAVGERRGFRRAVVVRRGAGLPQLRK